LNGLLIALLAWASPQPATVDPCVKLVPNDLARVLERRFPQERLPLSTDTYEEGRRDAAARGNSCVLVASADFDGDARPDLVVVLPGKNATSYRLIVALNKLSGYGVSSLLTWKGPVANMSVYPAEPGAYTHTMDYAFSPEPGSVEHIVTSHRGFWFGELEGGADVYFFRKGKWSFVHAVD
jgi:hypothetical protein